METFVRDYPGAIERSASAAEGVISGVIATEGEASDGHIIDVSGMDLPTRPPLLFGHDDYSGERNLGSWESLRKTGTRAGGRQLRGSAKVELGGPDGQQKAWRADMAYMVGQGHIRGLSVRWAPKDSPVRRVNLSKDHWAHVDDAKLDFGDPRAHGLFFGTSVMQEASVVTFGADPGALIGRSQEVTGELKSFWRGLAQETLDHDFPARDGGILVRGRDGLEFLVPAWVYEKLMGTSNERLRKAFDLVSAEYRVEREMEQEEDEVEHDPAPRQDPEAPAGDPEVQEPDPLAALERFEKRLAEMGPNLEARLDARLRRFTGELP